MDVSMVRPTELTCPACGRDFTMDVWLIVDAAARPDLVEQIREGSLYEMICPHCDHQGTLDAPLLLFRPDQVPPLLFSPARLTSEQQDREQAAHLLGVLKEALGEAWQEEWLAAGLPFVPLEALPAALSEDPEAALREVLERTGETVRDLAEKRTPAPQLASCVREFLQSKTWIEAQNLVEENPVLLSDEADRLLGHIIESHGDSEEDVAYVEEHRALLRNCRELGVEQAFDEKTGALPEEMRRLIGALSELPDEQRRAVEKVLTEVDDYEDVEAALEERPDLAPILDRILHQTVEAGLSQHLRAFVQAETCSQAGEVLALHPGLLSDEALSMLQDLIGDSEEGEERRLLEERYLFLRRCRQVGVSEALKEQEE